MRSCSKNTNEAGMVSLIMVMFFTLLTLVVTLGFVRLMLVEQRQADDDNLSNMAKMTAEAGIEDGKRAILKYTSLESSDPKKAIYRTALTSPNDCTAISGNVTIQSDLGLKPNGEVASGQNYTCLTVNLNTFEFKGSAKKESRTIPLKSTAPFNEIKIAWHLISQRAPEEGDGIPGGYLNGPSLPTAGNWAAGPKKPVLLRLQLFSYPIGDISRASLNASNRSITLIPSSGGDNEVNIMAADPKTGWSTPVSAFAKAGVEEVRCNTGALGSYACTTTVKFNSGFTSAGSNYFLRVTPLYGDSGTNYEVRLQNNTTPVLLDGVQPIIDATGKVTDVYRRIEARVMFDSSMAAPDYALETAQDLCKTMLIARVSEYRANACSP